MAEKYNNPMQVKLTREKEIFKCEFGDQKIKECIDLKLNSSELINRNVIKCLDTMLSTCIGKKDVGLKFLTSEVEISLLKDEENKFEIKNINLDLIPLVEAENELNIISQCLNFFNLSCLSKDSVKFSISYSDPKDSLKKYKQELIELKEQLERILGREIKV